MNFFHSRQIIILFLCVFCTQANAELFKWTDEKGKIHYSDKKPDEKTQTRVVPVKKGVIGNNTENESLSKAIIRPYEKTARKLFLLDTLYAWRKASGTKQSRKVGAYYVGKGCTSRGAMKVPDVFITHKSLFPKESANAYSIKKIIKSLDYEADKTTKYKLLDNMKKTGGLSLHSEITGLDYNTCASNLSSRDRLTKINKVSSYKFNKHRIKLRIRWQLKTNRDQDVLYEGTTNGSYNGWNSVASAGEAFSTAVEAATIKLFSDQDFINKILVEEDAVNLQAASIQKTNPVKLSGKGNTHNLYFSLNDHQWVTKLKPVDSVGSLYFGDRCSAKKNLVMKDASISHQWLFSNNTQPELAVIKRIHALGYSIKPASGDARTRNKNTGRHSLSGELFEVTYESCAASLSAATKYMSIDKISARKFNRNKITVTINWKLSSDGNGKVLFQTKTRGIAGSLLTQSDGRKTLNDAIILAAEQLFSDANFIQKISRPVSKPGVMSVFPEQPSISRGMVRPKDSEVKKLFLVAENEVWKNLNTGSDIGYYAYGHSCTPFKQKKWPQALNEYPGLFPKVNDFLNAEANVLKSLDYAYQTTDQYNVIKLKRKNGGYSLHARVLELRYDSCAPDIRDQDILNQNSKISSSRFKRHRANLIIQWTLQGVSSDDLVFETQTQGSADSWLLNSKPKILVNAAVQQATHNLFADKEFINTLLNKKNAQEDEGFFSKIFSFGSPQTDSNLSSVIKNKYILKAHLSQALVDMSQVKMMLANYYIERGELPYSLSDMGLSNEVFDNSKSISEISIQSDGAIIAELRDIFGSNKVLQLTPDIQGITNFRGLTWQCSSNLTKDMLPVNCETF